MVKPQLLAYLRCLEDRSALEVASTTLLGSLNAAIAAGQVQNRGGRRVSAPLVEALVRADGKLVYPVEDGIPKMLADEAIDVPASCLAGNAGK
jgi:uncharacterized protein